MRPLIPWFEQPVLNIPVGPLGDVLASISGSKTPIESVPIHGFGVLVALGFMVGGRIAMDRAKRVGLDPEQINQLIGWLVLGTFVGGHVGYGLMYQPDEFLANPALFLRLWDGLSSWGGFLACLLLSIWFFRTRSLSFWSYMDNVAFGLGIGWFFGRMGCFVAHDHPGPATDFYLGVYGVCPPGHNRLPDLACHDMGLYEALWSLATFGVMLLLDRKPRVPGFYPLLMGLLYTPTRFFMDFLRPESTDARWLDFTGVGLTGAQVWSAVFFVVCAALMRQRLASGDAPLWRPPGAGTQAPAA